MAVTATEYSNWTFGDRLLFQVASASVLANVRARPYVVQIEPKLLLIFTNCARFAAISCAAVPFDRITPGAVHPRGASKSVVPPAVNAITSVPVAPETRLNVPVVEL